MIIRVWKGWTSLENADAYEHLLKTEIFPGIRAKCTSGLLQMELFRRNNDDEVEFMTVHRFDSIESVKRMSGSDSEIAYVPESAKCVLKHFETTARHFESSV